MAGGSPSAPHASPGRHVRRCPQSRSLRPRLTTVGSKAALQQSMEGWATRGQQVQAPVRRPGDDAENPSRILVTLCSFQRS